MLYCIHLITQIFIRYFNSFYHFVKISAIPDKLRISRGIRPSNTKKKEFRIISICLSSLDMLLLLFGTNDMDELNEAKKTDDDKADDGKSDDVSVDGTEHEDDENRSDDTTMLELLV
uniref:Uncharacterized protein n=1 Tax=Onchocerca volvulus TaxID=6282 RepID=A0A8R1XMY2_ONCVO